MNNTEETKKFTIRMQRNQIAEVDIEVEAINDAEAIDKAMELAENETDASGFALDWDEVDYTFEAIDVECDEDEEDEA
jgi:hypothetical protein